MRKKVIGISILVFVALFFIFNFASSVRFFGVLKGAITPVFFGLILGIMLNGPVGFFEKKVYKHKKLNKLRKPLALLTTFLILILILALIIFVVAPGITSSVQRFIDSMDSFSANGFKAMVEENGFIYNLLDRFGAQIDSGLSGIKENIAGGMASHLKLALNLVLGAVFAVLIVAGKEQLVNQFYKLFKYFFGELKAKKIVAATAGACEKLQKFLLGQIIESIIFGVAIYLFLLAFQIPYALLGALIVAVGNLIPIVGAFVAGALVFAITLTISAEKAIIAIIIIVVVQQIENVTLYPIIVGKYVGLSSFWTLFAVIVGGFLFGFFGLLLGVPIVAFIDNFMKVLYAMKEKRETALQIA